MWIMRSCQLSLTLRIRQILFRIKTRSKILLKKVQARHYLHHNETQLLMLLLIIQESQAKIKLSTFQKLNNFSLNLKCNWRASWIMSKEKVEAKHCSNEYLRLEECTLSFSLSMKLFFFFFFYLFFFFLFLFFFIFFFFHFLSVSEVLTTGIQLGKTSSFRNFAPDFAYYRKIENIRIPALIGARKISELTHDRYKSFRLLTYEIKKKKKKKKENRV